MSEFRIHLRAPDEPDCPAEVLLRQALKALKRRFGLTCTSVEEVKDTHVEKPAEQAEGKTSDQQQ